MRVWPLPSINQTAAWSADESTAMGAGPASKQGCPSSDPHGRGADLAAGRASGLWRQGPLAPLRRWRCALDKALCGAERRSLKGLGIAAKWCYLRFIHC